MKSISCLLLASLLVWAIPAMAAGKLRCNNRLVGEGDRAAELLAACGEPAYRDAWGYSQPGGNILADTEEWTYNFGPHELLRVVRVRNGRVYSIDSDSYGFYDAPERRCESTALVPGLSKYRLLQICGEPLTRRSFGLVRPLDARGRRAYANAYETVYREEWVYNFGSRYLMRILRIENGRIVDVENGGRGYD
ncbi:DUF2845 domain-containing protein [Solimonas sp. K1W22B-7]|uniref:DUF2845 domain-containing protein n=1 Tax=Solimonas sp. K1W22B-7 TaxID=2303331 RepID=UPI0013C45751|nr:DUF2845 domain-containing protein [Solimonas sp. K1W22B-7]